MTFLGVDVSCEFDWIWQPNPDCLSRKYLQVSEGLPFEDLQEVVPLDNRFSHH